MMARTLIVAAAAASAMLLGGATPASSQTPGAEVRTWSGEVYQLAEPSLEVLYTIVVPGKGEGPQPPEAGASTGAAAPMLFGSAGSISRFLEDQPEPLQGRRQSETITLHKGDARIRLDVASIATLAFVRHPARSTLPPYVASEHYRYSATATLNDGSRIQADYVSLGTTFLRGRTAHGRVDVPWQHIETVRFTR